MKRLPTFEKSSLYSSSLSIMLKPFAYVHHSLLVRPRRPPLPIRRDLLHLKAARGEVQEPPHSTPRPRTPKCSSRGTSLTGSSSTKTTWPVSPSSSKRSSRPKAWCLSLPTWPLVSRSQALSLSPRAHQPHGQSQLPGHTPSEVPAQAVRPTGPSQLTHPIDEYSLLS